MRLLLLLIVFFGSPAFGQEVPLQSGDVIFQTSNSKQSFAIMWASKSLYSHVGIVEVVGKEKFVLEAISKVSRTPFDKWVNRGRLGRFSIYRYEGLNEKDRDSIVMTAKKYLGRPYDIFFTSKNDEIYCSELVDLAYQKAGHPIGKVEKVKDLDVDNWIVRKLVKERWRKHPLCKKNAKTFDSCWAKILEDELITPDGLTHDSHLRKIWSNYP